MRAHVHRSKPLLIDAEPPALSSPSLLSDKIPKPSLPRRPLSMDSSHTSKSSMTSVTTYDVVKAESEHEVEPQLEQQWIASRQVKLVVLGQMFVVFAISLDMTILTATLPVCGTLLMI